jgi:hypothetical protein
MGARPHYGDAPAELGRGRGFRLRGHVPERRSRAAGIQVLRAAGT